jgi:hypothetical protein
MESNNKLTHGQAIAIMLLMVAVFLIFAIILAGLSEMFRP